VPHPWPGSPANPVLVCWGGWPVLPRVGIFPSEISPLFELTMHCRATITMVMLVLLCAAPAAATSITGTVRNNTTGQPAAGDDVILLRLAHGMEQEEARTKNRRSRRLPPARKPPRGPSCGARLPSGCELRRDGVFNAVPRIPGLSGNLGIVQVTSEGTTLKVTEMYAITNASSPPVTQSDERNFEFSLGPTGVLNSFKVKHPAGVWVNVSPLPMQHQKGRFRVNFPLRPGTTFFRFVYSLPSAGSTTLRLELPYPIWNFGVLHPPSMSFTAVPPAAFRSPGLVRGLRLEQAVMQPLVGRVPAFTLMAPPIILPENQPTLLSTTPAERNPGLAQANAGAKTSRQTNNTPWIMLAALVAVSAVFAYAAWRRGQNGRVLGHCRPTQP
jgi:hypothetical protein